MRVKKFNDDKEFKKLRDKTEKLRPKSGKIDYSKAGELSLSWAEKHFEASIRECKREAKHYLNKKDRLEAKKQLRNI